MEELTNGLKKDYGSLGRTNESKRKEAVRNDKRTNDGLCGKTHEGKDGW